MRSKLEERAAKTAPPDETPQPLGSTQPTQGVEPLAEAAVADAANGLKFKMRAACLAGVREVHRLVRKALHDLDDYLTD